MKGTVIGFCRKGSSKGTTRLVEGAEKGPRGSSTVWVPYHIGVALRVKALRGLRVWKFRGLGFGGLEFRV